MREWVKNNIVQILVILITVTFGYANFTKDIEINAKGLIDTNTRVDKMDEKLDKAIRLLERIDERTSNGTRKRDN